MKFFFFGGGMLFSTNIIVNEWCLLKIIILSFNMSNFKKNK